LLKLNLPVVGGDTRRVAEIIRFCTLMIGAGHEDDNDADALRRDPMFKLALDRLPAGEELCRWQRGPPPS